MPTVPANIWANAASLCPSCNLSNSKVVVRMGPSRITLATGFSAVVCQRFLAAIPQLVPTKTISPF
ncbi:MAG: hypothetical protein RLZZ130_1436 [Pseudomonadota bacterium]|jgi:hypothetical protein